MKNILITGASGFVGKRYVVYNKEKYNIKTVSLRKTKVEDVNYQNIDTIVHFAGMAHQMKKIPDSIYFDVNYELTKQFAEQARTKGVKHFIFISTIKVFGEYQEGVLSENSPCIPVDDPYGQSKLDAENYLRSIQDNNFIISIVRPPLVYGPEVKGNLIRFLHLANTNYPLPLKDTNNRRTMVFLDNLIELINTITERQQAGIFLAGDDRPISTSLLIAEMRKNLDKKPRLFPMPSLFRFLLSKVKPSFEIRLYGSLEMDTSLTNKTLNFTPPYSIEHGIAQMVNWFKINNKK